LPRGNYKEVGYDARQVIDIDISQVVTEYRAQILEDAGGKRYTTPFPEGVNRPVHYGVNLKVHSVYLSQYQLIPYNRIEETFRDQAEIPVAAGSIYNFNILRTISNGSRNNGLTIPCPAFCPCFRRFSIHPPPYGGHYECWSQNIPQVPVHQTPD